RTLPTAPTAKAQAAQQVPTIVANADLVNMIFSVEGKHGGFVPDLSQADFEVLEDGHPQQVRFFSLEDQLPLTLGLLLDTSPSQANVLRQEQQISDQFFRQVLTPKDLAFVVGFDVDTTLLQDLTASTERLGQAVDQAHIGGADATAGGINPGTFPQASSGGATHLWDAIYLACHDELAHQAGRKAIIVVTDGGEQGSTYTEQDALHAALDSNTVVFAIIAADPRFQYFPGGGSGQLRKITEQTGGRSINAGNHLAAAYTEIQNELRSQYTLAYRSDNKARNGKFRAVKIELQGAAAKRNDGAKVRARTGYFAPGPGQ
ncbi:MAG: VWA domain-containing protein, partial [Terriglobales bacterium]